MTIVMINILIQTTCVHSDEVNMKSTHVVITVIV